MAAAALCRAPSRMLLILSLGEMLSRGIARRGCEVFGATCAGVSGEIARGGRVGEIDGGVFTGGGSGGSLLGDGEDILLNSWQCSTSQVWMRLGKVEACKGFDVFEGS